MAMGQKEAVVSEVIAHIPTFRKNVDNAILMLTSTQLEMIKSRIYGMILTGLVEYSKDITNTVEVRSYARSMVMNHIKKAKELNGGHSFTSNLNSNSNKAFRTIRVKEKIAPKGVNPDLLPQELAEYAKTLVK